MNRTGALKGGTLSDLLASILLQNIKKLNEGPFGDIKKLPEKSPGGEQNRKGDPLVLVRFLMLC